MTALAGDGRTNASSVERILTEPGPLPQDPNLRTLAEHISGPLVHTCFSIGKGSKEKKKKKKVFSDRVVHLKVVYALSECFLTFLNGSTHQHLVLHRTAQNGTNSSEWSGGSDCTAGSTCPQFCLDLPTRFGRSNWPKSVEVGEI